MPPFVEFLKLNVVPIYEMQAMPQLTDRSKLPGIVDPVVRDTMDLKHLYQVRKLQTQTFTFLIMLIILEGATRIDPNPEQTKPTLNGFSGYGLIE